MLQTLSKQDHERLWCDLRDMTHRLLLRNPVGSGQNIDCEVEEQLVTKQHFFSKNNMYLHCNTVDLHCMYIVCYVNTLSDPVYRSNQTLKFFPVPRYKGHAFVLLAVVQKKIAITVTHTRLPLLNHQASVLHWKNLSGACLWQTVRAAV